MPWFRPIFFYQNSFARFFRYFEKKKEKNKPLFSCTITIIDHTLYVKVKNENTQAYPVKRTLPLNPEEEGKIIRNLGSKALKRKLSNQSSFIGNHLFIYPWTAFHSTLTIIN